MSSSTTSRTRACEKRIDPWPSVASMTSRSTNAGSRSSMHWSSVTPAARLRSPNDVSRPIVAATWSRSIVAGGSRARRRCTTSRTPAGTAARRTCSSAVSPSSATSRRASSPTKNGLPSERRWIASITSGGELRRRLPRVPARRSRRHSSPSSCIRLASGRREMWRVRARRHRCVRARTVERWHAITTRAPTKLPATNSTSSSEARSAHCTSSRASISGWRPAARCSRR